MASPSQLIGQTISHYRVIEKSPAELKKTLQFTEHGIFARDAREIEDMIESMCERAQTQPDWNPSPGDPT